MKCVSEFMETNHSTELNQAYSSTKKVVKEAGDVIWKCIVQDLFSLRESEATPCSNENTSPGGFSAPLWPGPHPSISLIGDTWPFIPDTQLVPWFCLVPPCKHICIYPFLPSPRLHLWQDPPQLQRRGSSLCFYKSYTETSKRRAITEVSGIVWKRATWSPQKGPGSLSASACCFSVQRLPPTRHVDTSAPPSGFSMKCGAKCETEVGNRKRAVRGSKS